MAWLGWVGFNRGIVDELGRFLGLILASLIGLTWYIDIAGLILNVFILDPGVALVLGFSLLFGLSLLLTRFITHLVHYLIVSGSTQWVNQGMGFLFGALKGGVIIGVFIWLVDISPMKNWSEILHKNSMVVQKTTQVRQLVIRFFGWADPVNEGEKYLENLMIYGIISEEND